MSAKFDLLSLADRISFGALLVGFFGAILTCSLMFLLLSTCAPGHGVRSEDGSVNFFDCLYFSTVTISSLGYGDLKPVGASRAVAGAEVLVGLVVVGLAIAKLAAQGTSSIRRLHRRIGGTWIDVARFRNGDRIFGVVHISLSEGGLSLRFTGQNYDQTGRQIGDFNSQLIDVKWPVLRFFYEASPGVRSFSSGVVRLRFEEEADDECVSQYAGEAMDFERNVADSLEGWRLLERSRKKRLANPDTRRDEIVDLIHELFSDDTKADHSC